ncbi:MAG: transcription antitermination factor NusB [Microthrixaceae bacterium]
MTDTPHLFDPDEFGIPDPVAAHDADIVDDDPEAAEPAGHVDHEALLDAPVPAPDDGPEPESDVDAEPVSRAVLDTVLDPDTVVERIAVGAPPALRPVAGGRHEARERAVHLLYEVHAKDRTADEVLGEQVLAPDEYTVELVRGVHRHRGELDAQIDRLARGWTVARMPTMDVIVLRLALYELAHQHQVPRGVVLSEAVDLAGQYGTDDSARFVNGLLSAAADELRS